MNNFRTRKFFARLLLPILTVWMCLTPAQAWIGPVASLAMRLGASAEFATAVEVSTILHGAVIGMFLPYLEVSNPSTGDAVRIPLTVDVSLQVPAPIAVAPDVIPEHPAYQFNDFGRPAFGTFCAAAEDLLAVMPDGFSVQCDEVSRWADYYSSPGVYNHSRGSGASYGYATITTISATCPSGSTLVGAPPYTCEVDNPRAAMPDNKCDFVRTSSALVMLSDPDCAKPTVADMLLSCQASGNNCSFDSRDISGTAMRMGAAINAANGGTDITVQSARTSGNTSLIDTTTVSIDGTGHVTAVTGGTQTGSISVDPVNGQYQVNGTGNVVTGTTASFPSDYAKSGEAATAAAGLGTKLDQLHTDLSTTISTTDPTEPTANDMPGWGNTFSGLLSWQLPAHSGTCPTPSLDLSSVLGVGKVYAFDAHCTLINNHFQALNAAMTVVWSMLALFIVLRA